MKDVRKFLAGAAAAIFLLLFPPMMSAHCDTKAGPVIADARVALETGTITPVLKWVKPAHEAEVRAAFNKSLKVRTQSAEAQDIADEYFFETLVRLHRAGEGAPYTGLKPAEAAEPIVVTADKMLETGAVGPAIQDLQNAIAEGVRYRFARTVKARKRAGDSVASGREYVAAYVEFVHYLEALDRIAGARPHHTTAMASEHVH
jgi:hypothetical protein